MRTLAQTGNGWMTFKDASNEKCNQTGRDRRRRHAHASCTCRTCAPRSSRSPTRTNTAVCNLGSLNLGDYVVVRRRQVRLRPPRRVVRQVVPFLDRVIDINYYPTAEAELSNEQVASRRPRPDGPAGRLLQDGLPFDSADARGSVARSAHTSTSMRCGRRPNSPRPAARTQPSTAPVPRRATCSSTCGRRSSQPAGRARLGRRCASRIAEHGLRNSS